MFTCSRARRGFTLIEVLIVLGIIILLAGAAIVALVPQQKGARIDTTKLKMKSIETALEAYNVNIGHYPNEQEGGIDALRTRPAFDTEQLNEMWRGPYLKEDPRDAWGNKYNYQVTQAGTPEADQTPYRLWSNGPDGMDGTDDDIKNWSDTTGMP
ncbi:MAG: type II secretion system protein GspG [Planctomycetes bacterium]|nr:type II secretion system protein GspG [Planctomycetota bacterium]